VWLSGWVEVVAVIPRGARVLELEEALRFQVAWSTEDRDRVRSILEVEFPGCRRGDAFPEGFEPHEDWPVALTWYVPPPGAYVAGHGVDKSKYRRKDLNVALKKQGLEPFGRWGDKPPQNRVYLHAGFAIVHADRPDPIRIELSASRESHRGLGSSSGRVPEVCPECFLAHAGECP